MSPDKHPPTLDPPVRHRRVCPRLFSGWGVRTLADGEGRFNPIGYHVGTVWPFDNSFIAWGLAAVRIQGGGRPDRRRHPRCRRILRRTAPGSLWWLSADANPLSGSVPNGLQPTSMVHGRAAAVTANDAGPRPDRGKPDR